MTIRELKTLLSKYRNDAIVDVNIFLSDSNQAVALGAIVDITNCQCCGEPKLCVVLADDADADAPEASAPRPMDFTPKR